MSNSRGSTDGVAGTPFERMKAPSFSSQSKPRPETRVTSRCDIVVVLDTNPKPMPSSQGKMWGAVFQGPASGVTDAGFIASKGPNRGASIFCSPNAPDLVALLAIFSKRPHLRAPLSGIPESAGGAMTSWAPPKSPMWA